VPHPLNAGLLLAKFSRKSLAIDESAPPLPTKHLHGGEGILLIENDTSVPDMAAINYGFAIDADIALVSATDESHVRSLPRQLEAWSKDKSHHEFAWAKRGASKRLRDVNFATYKFATSFTKGLPYGLFIGNVIPCSHVMKELDCGSPCLRGERFFADAHFTYIKDRRRTVEWPHSASG